MDELREIVEAATPGPWNERHELNGPHDVYVYNLGQFRDVWRCVASSDGTIQGQQDARFIATFNPERVKAMLDVVEEARRFDWDRPTTDALARLDCLTEGKARVS